ncbi:unnamed protein product [Diplocarpon coronariae]
MLLYISQRAMPESAYLSTHQIAASATLQRFKHKIQTRRFTDSL